MKNKSIWKDSVNLPNAMTVFRVLLLPLFLYLLFQKEILYQIIAFVLFAIASLTDLVDGYLARKWNQETEFGKFLDPLADKFLVIGSFTAFLFLHEQIELWMVVLIIARDLLITILRYLAIKGGSSLRTTMMGKVKTAFQMTAICVILVTFMLLSGNRRKAINEHYAQGRLQGQSTAEIALENVSQYQSKLSNDEDLTPKQHLTHLASFVPYYAMLLTTIVTALSGGRYLVTNGNLLYPSHIKKVIFK